MLYGHAPSWRAQTFSTHPVPSSVSTSTDEPLHRDPVRAEADAPTAALAAEPRERRDCRGLPRRRLLELLCRDQRLDAGGRHPSGRLDDAIAHAHALDLIGIAGLGNPEPAVAIPGHADCDRDLVEADADRRRQAADDRRAGIGRRAHRLALLVEVVRPALEAAFDRAVGRRARGLRRRESGPADERKHQKQSPHATLPETETVA